MLPLALVGIAGGSALCARLGSAGVLTSRAAPRLTATERRAITIASASAIGDRSLGLVVIVRFNADIERYLGQNGLSHGLVAAELVPGPSSSAASGLVDEGGGFTSVRVPLFAYRAGRVLVGQGIGRRFGVERVLRIGVPNQAEVIRVGKRIAFYFPGAAIGDVAAIRLESFASTPAARASLTSAHWRGLLASAPASQMTVRFDPTGLSCQQLAALRVELSGLLSRLDSELRRVAQARAEFRAAIDDYATVGRLLHVSRAGLVRQFATSTARLDRVQTEFGAVEVPLATLNERLGAC